MKIKNWIFSSFILISCNNQNSTDNDQVDGIKETIPFPIQNPASQVVSFSQEDSNLLVQNFSVSDNQIFSDVFKQQEVKAPQIDILVVIDNSGSMEEEQLNLSDKLSFLIGDLNDVDWMLNVITTDQICKRVAGLPIGPKTPNSLSIFEDAVRAGTGGDASETALYNAYRHLKGECRTDGNWRRENASVAVIIVSDEDEDYFSGYYHNARKYLQDIEKLGLVLGDTYKTYGIIGHPEQPCSAVSTYADTYIDAINSSGGLWGSICDDDYSATLSAIARDIRKNLKFRLPLKYSPVFTTIKLVLDGTSYEAPWSLVGQDIILSVAIPEGSILNIEYQIESARLLRFNSINSSYALDSVQFNGETLESKKYVYDSKKETVLLTFDPRVGDDIKVILVKKETQKLEYPFPQASVKEIKCFVDNKKFISKVEVKRQTIKFDPPIPNGKTVNCLYN